MEELFASPALLPFFISASLSLCFVLIIVFYVILSGVEEEIVISLPLIRAEILPITFTNSQEPSNAKKANRYSNGRRETMHKLSTPTFPVNKTANSIENKIIAETESKNDKQIQIITTTGGGAISTAIFLLNLSI